VACEAAWCGPCYKPLGNLPYPVKAQVDEEGELLDSGQLGRFMTARAGDHLMTPFQCKLCHFRNIMGWDPVTGEYDGVELFEIMRRANLDAFWEQASSTVGSNLRAGMRSERTTGRLNMLSLTPPMGPFPLKDLLGMSVAIAVLD
jgi:hypothetical protein